MNSSTSKRVCFHLVAAGREGGIAEIRGSAQHKVPMLPLPVLVSTRLYTRIFQCSQKFQARPSTALCTLNPQSFHPGRDSGGGGGSKNQLANAGSRVPKHPGTCSPQPARSEPFLQCHTALAQEPYSEPGPTKAAAGRGHPQTGVGARTESLGRGKSCGTGLCRAAPATNQMATDGDGCARRHSPSSCKLIQWPATPLPCFAPGPPSNPTILRAKEVPRTFAKQLDRERKGMGHFRHSMVRYHRVGVARRSRGWSSAGAVTGSVGNARVAGFRKCHSF